MTNARALLSHPGGVGLLLALLVAVPTLFWPYGGDHALFDYVGRAWLDGTWPYEGAVDHKPPGVFLLFLFARLLALGGQWGIRALEILLVLSLAVPVAGLIGHGRPDRGRIGSAALLCAGFHFVHLDYWRTGQTETWVVGLALWACWLVLRRRLAWSLLAGALLGAAFTLKFTVVLLALPVAVLAVTHGGRRERVRRAGLLLLSGLFVCAAVFGPFLATGRGEVMWATLVSFNRYYALEVPFREWGWWSFWIGAAPVVSVAAGLGFMVALLEGRTGWRALILWAAFTGTALLTVVWQNKYLAYHWAIALPLAAGWALWGLEALHRVHRLAPLVGAFSLVVAAIATQAPPAFHTQDWAPRPYRQAVLSLVELGDQAGYLDGFDYLHSTADQAAIAARVEALARPGDSLCVVGIFAPTVYAWTDLRCPSPFFSDHGLAYLDWKPEQAGELVAWRARHEEALRRHPSTFVVTFSELSSVAERQSGVPYGVVATEGPFLLMKRAEP